MIKVYKILFAAVAGIFSLAATAQISNYCLSNHSSQFDSKIDSVVLNTIQQGSNPSLCETYTDNTAISTILAPGATYTIRVRTGSCGGSFTNYQRAWIDFDQNNVFDDPAERIINTTGPAFATYSATFTVPSTALGGNTFMRVVSSETSTYGPCTSTFYGETEDYSIVILSNTENDAGVSELVAPDGGCAGTYNVRARINNFGINQIQPVLVEWSVNGVNQTAYTHSTLLDTLNGTGPNSAVVTIGTITLSGGSDTLKIWTNLPNNVQDTSNLNDTLTKIFNSLPVISTFPYYEDFENGSGSEWFAMGTNSTWALGTPAKANIVGAASGDSAWVNGGLTGNYLASDQSSMNSPCFDLSGFEGTAWVALDINWYTEGGWDGAVLQSSVDAGKTWQRVGQQGDPFNWYNATSLTANPGGQSQGWAGTGTSSSNGWKRAKHIIDPSAVVENLRFRIAFGSDGSVQYEGFAFDNFTIVDYKAANLGPNILSLCGNSFTELDPHVNFNGYISWSTGDSINEKINATTTGTYWVMYTDSMIDVTSYDTIEMIQSVAPQIQFESLVDTILLTGSTTLDPKTSTALTYDWQPGGFNYPYLLVRGADYGVGTHTFSLTVTDSLLCKDQEQVNVVVIDITGIDENENASINFYPNPVQDELSVELNGFDNSPVSMQILDIQGKMHMNYTFDHVQGQTHKLNLNSLMKGAYILRVQSESKNAVVRLIVN